jgi:tetratricopeptide (TPR) repeat protein
LEKNRLLDAYLKTLALAVIALTIASCAFPRIAILHDPLSPEEHVNLGVSYEKRGELDAALKEYKAASKRLPLAKLYMGNVYFQQKNLPQAEKSYREAIKKTQAAEAYNNLAWLYYTTNTRLDEAEQLAARAVELSPDTEEFKNTLAQIREKRGREKLSSTSLTS